MHSVYRLFCTSQKVLTEYASCGSLPQSQLCAKILEAVQLSLRVENVHHPDHAHRNKNDFAFAGKTSLADLLLHALGSGEDARKQQVNLLIIQNNILYVKQDELEKWQREVTAHQCPLPLLVAEWEAYGYEQGKKIHDTAQNVATMLTKSTLPSINEKRLNGLIQNEKGTQGNLQDLHIHFNGTTEFTQIWLHALTHPRSTRTSLNSAYANAKVKRYYKQCDAGPYQMFMLLKRAALLREYICQYIHTYFYGSMRKLTRAQNGSMRKLTRAQICKAITASSIPPISTFRHPLIFYFKSCKTSQLQAEGIMWLYALRALRKTKSVDLSMLLHVYILLQNKYLRLLVQQREQFGFDQFQYITLMGAREPLESNNATERFEQCKGMYGPDLAHVEARFAPKDKAQKTIDLLRFIWHGYQLSFPVGAYPPMSLGLVAHFIKEKDNTKGLYRHQKYRAQLYNKAHALIMAQNILRRGGNPLHKALVGKDAAANEMETPPEVFAPIFRYLNMEGLCNTTFHVGEDFEHILSGLRAVYEAITFLALKSGDRIGHGTALGIAPEYLSAHCMHCSQGQWFDNLVWLTQLITEKAELAEYGQFIPILEKNIQKLYFQIFASPCPELPVLWRAWRMRNIDVSLITGTILPSFAHAKAESKLIFEARKDIIAFTEFKKYHHSYYRKAWETQISINSLSLSVKLLHSVQDIIISEMCQKNILVEVLPTSNVRISQYSNTEEHHVLRWLSEDNSRPSPQVVLGTDDPGIFSTTMRNEFTLLLQNLQRKYPSSTNKPYQILQHLIENGRNYKFK